MKQELLNLTGFGKKEKRRELDFYPTPKNATIALMNFMFREKYMDFNTSVWEPACGDGHMSEVIKTYCPNVYSSDIRNTGYGNGEVDFLNYEDDRHEAIITNPPFNVSHKFIEKATERANIVCMLLKSQYWHSKGRYQLFFDNPPAYILPLTWRPDFLEHERKNGDKKGSPTMEVAWTVWIKGAHEAKYIPLLKPNS